MRLQDAAKRSSVDETKAADERDEARMERERAEKAAQDAYTAGIGNLAAESRIESEVRCVGSDEQDRLAGRHEDSELILITRATFTVAGPDCRLPDLNAIRCKLLITMPVLRSSRIRIPRNGRLSRTIRS